MVTKMKERKYYKANTEGWEHIIPFLVVDRPFAPAKIRKRKNSQPEQNKEENAEQE